ncbi:carboxypeptidase-like regulatory domain-containing protein [Pedobacter gandavensis]|uniref:carboxypeptidase-like regulatory domain-containing protein n=1 Tax=Pedobacter gandavensis TaxID=2679963 RepID=UPI002930A5EA|nr:carboxypeptidase-like regulatory domain-containing protein [Pedobacter gandavensis]
MFPSILLILMLFVYSANAQEEVHGSIKNAKGDPIPAATVTLKTAEGKIIAFSRSNEKGAYQIRVNNGSAKVSIIEAGSLGYKAEVMDFSDFHKNYHFILSEASIELPTVVVKHKPRLKIDGDTLNYKLSDFSSNQDRVLGDVLKKMPGIEVDKNGKILYNGKSISNFYIDGDNLLDDKYNIATKSIPKEAIDKVQVIQNDQPIKMLRNKMISDDVALNVTIKEEAKLKIMGQAELGAGVPERYNGNINAMMFNKKYKGINYLKGNNTGNDPAREIVSHNLADYKKAMDNPKPASLLSTAAAGGPDLPQNRYLFNRAALLNVNNLMNLKKEIQVKTNLYYLNDRQKLDYENFTEYELPTGNISFIEQQHHVSRPRQFRVQANVNANKAQSFFQNNFITDYKTNQYQVNLRSNTVPFQQELRQQTLDISNEFNYLNTLKNGNIYNLYSYLNYSHQPEKLLINAGLNPEIFNQGNPYAGLLQQTKIPSWYSNNYLSFKIGSKSGIFQTYKIGFSIQSQELKSSLFNIQENQELQASPINSLNQLEWNRSKVYTEGLYEYGAKEDRFTARLNVPLSYQQINYQDPGQAVDSNLNRLNVNPSLNLKYKTGLEQDLQFNYTLRDELGSMEDIYSAAILKNYRSLFANNAPLSERKSNTATLIYNHKKAISMLFFNIQASYIRLNRNTLSSSIITDHLQQRIVLPYDNKLNSYRLSGTVNKYLFAWRTTISMGLNWSQDKSNQFQNGILLPYRTINKGLKVGFQSKINNDINLSYQATINRNESKSPATSLISYAQLNQQMELSFMPINNLFVNFTAEHLNTKQSGQKKLSYLFSDLTLRYKINKINTDCEFIFSNIANIKTYKSIYVAENVFTAGTYKIPGSIALLKITLTF